MPATVIGQQGLIGSSSFEMHTPDAARCADTHLTITVTSSWTKRYAKTSAQVTISRSSQDRATATSSLSYEAHCYENVSVTLLRGSSSYYLEGSAWTSDCYNIDVCSKQAVGQAREVSPAQGGWVDAGSGPVNSQGCLNETVNYSTYNLHCSSLSRGASQDFRTYGIFTLVDTEGDFLGAPTETSAIGPYSLACG